jgi:hypothetical protein
MNTTSSAEKEAIIQKTLHYMLSIISQSTGETPVAAIFVVQFNRPQDAYASITTANLDVPGATPTQGLDLLPIPLALKVLDNLAERILAEIRVAKVHINTVRSSDA